MASLYKENDRGRDGYRLRFRDQHQKQRSLWLGKLSRRAAETIQRHVTELVRATKANVKPETDSVKWAESLTGRLRNRLVILGLVAGHGDHRTENARLLGAFVDRYIEERTDAKPSTLTNYRHARQWLVEFFGEGKPIAEITPADCDRWQRFLNRSLAPSTVEKILKRAKTMLRYAVRDRLLEENPFTDLRIGSSVNRDRDAFVPTFMANQVLAACPTQDWQLIFALARFGGLRTPSESLTLTWNDIDWQGCRIQIDSPKTGPRVLPLFPELRPILEEARADRSRSGSRIVSGNYGTGKNLRTQLRRIIESAGLTPWPKLFVNLRASRRTELQEQFPDHVVNAWMGHSSRIAEKHYLQVTPEHWQRATGGNTGGNIGATQQASSALDDGKKKGNRRSDGHRFPMIAAIAPRTRRFSNDTRARRILNSCVGTELASSSPARWVRGGWLPNSFQPKRRP